MLDLASAPTELLDPVNRVVVAATRSVDTLDPASVMVVGAWCRDILHRALGHSFQTAATRDLDLAIAMSSWSTFEALADAFPRRGNSGIRFEIAGLNVDVVPFGGVEDPVGTSTPPIPAGTLSVWAMDEVRACSLDLELGGGARVRIPSVAGYAAAKLGAWLDRSTWQETKDAGDLALALYWYAESETVADRLYETDEGQQILIRHDMDVPLAAAELLGADVMSSIGPHRLSELLPRWPGNEELLLRDLNLTEAAGLRWQRDRRTALVHALTRGLRGANP